ncbi:MAG TPA: hypothetical protein VHN82_00835 [Methanoregula sp.]|nr:hypothetical protein [Methanoregula sp.]
MPTCANCISYLQKEKDQGGCRINGETTPDCESERCFVPHVYSKARLTLIRYTSHATRT